ncbi:nicotinamide-nucleotide amidohydrolase PncC [Thalassotalea profundi]|uniref:CinA-like protein n=2 Tax=Thalassotalea profundi TaxID=2036687 RepID=A0ABQ3INQ7_9GAMM|nr:nicotinamide-nucleotide amidohydrolase PncC [Thalassotalea profundi]
MTPLNVQLLLTGNELMTGDVTDTNSIVIAQALKEIGVEVYRKVTIGDDESLLKNEIISMSKSADVLIINGGLGPTVDDLTAHALALASNSKLTLNLDAEKHLQRWSIEKGAELSKANLKQALLPESAVIIPNDIGSAVGFSLTLNKCKIHCTPGVPRELILMLTNSLIPEIRALLPESPCYKVKRFQVYGLGESNLQMLIDNNFPDWPSSLDLGFRAKSPFIELKLTTRTSAGIDVLPIWEDKIQRLLGAHILAEIKDNEFSMPEHVLNLLSDRNLKITTAESCTGGLIASLMTSIANASLNFEAGFVTYSNQMKSELINVNSKTLEQYGAVSKEVVEEMALGALKKSNANIAIAVSGIAGPSGGSPDKPVGSVWIAWGSESNLQSAYFCIKGNRQYFQKAVAYRSLDLVRRFLLNISEEPFYTHKLNKS